MGFCLSEPIGTLSSDKFIEIEEYLKFNKHSSNDIRATILRYTLDGLMNENQFKKVIHNLKLNTKDTTDFYNLFRVPSERGSAVYCSRRLITLGVLLGNADSVQKATFLFIDHDSDEDKGLLSYDEANVLIQDIFDIATDYIPQLAITLAHEDKKEVYREDRAHFLTVKAVLINYYTKKLIPNWYNELSLEKFLKKIRGTGNIPDLIDTHKLRNYAEEIYQSSQTPVEEGESHSEKHSESHRIKHFHTNELEIPNKRKNKKKPMIFPLHKEEPYI